MNMNELISASLIDNSKTPAFCSNVNREIDKKAVPYTIQEMLDIFDDDIADTTTLSERVEVVRAMLSENKRAEKFNKKIDENERVISAIKELIKETSCHEIRQDMFGEYVVDRVEGLPPYSVPRQRIECALNDMVKEGKVKRFYRNEGKSTFPCFIYIG